MRKDRCDSEITRRGDRMSEVLLTMMSGQKCVLPEKNGTMVETVERGLGRGWRYGVMRRVGDRWLCFGRTSVNIEKMSTGKNFRAWYKHLQWTRRVNST